MVSRVRVLLMLGLFMVAGAANSQEATNQEKPSPEQIYQQVDILWIVRRGQLDSEQVTQIIPLVESVSAARHKLLTEADDLWQEHQDTIEQVLQRWIGGGPGPVAGLSSVQPVVAHFRRQDADVQTSIVRAIEQILALLSADQARLVETRQERQQRQQLRAELGQVDNLPEYIVQQLAAQRELMPDEYELVRAIEARRLAAVIIDPRAPAYDRAAGAVLRLTDTVYNWPQQQYNAQYPALAEQVARFLNLPTPTEAPPISYDELVSFVSSGYAADLLRQMSAEAQTGVERVESPARGLADHPLSVAVAKSDLLSVLNDLQLVPQQIQALLPLANRAGQATAKSEQLMAAKYAELEATFQQAYQTLIVSSEVPPEVESGLADVRETRKEARHQQRVEIAAILRQVQTILAPQQNALIDWLPPAEVIQADPQEKIARQRRIAAEMARAVGFLERLRYRDPLAYIQTRIGDVEEYLSNYVARQSPRFPELRSFIIDLLDRMKMVEEPDWRGAAPQLAAQLLDGLGVLADISGRGATGRPLSWEDLYQVFTSPYTPELLQKMLKARSQQTY